MPAKCEMYGHAVLPQPRYRLDDPVETLAPRQPPHREQQFFTGPNTETLSQSGRVEPGPKHDGIHSGIDDG